MLTETGSELEAEPALLELMELAGSSCQNQPLLSEECSAGLGSKKITLLGLGNGGQGLKCLFEVLREALEPGPKDTQSLNLKER